MRENTNHGQHLQSRDYTLAPAHPVNSTVDVPPSDVEPCEVTSHEEFASTGRLLLQQLSNPVKLAWVATSEGENESFPVAKVTHCSVLLFPCGPVHGTKSAKHLEREKFKILIRVKEFTDFAVDRSDDYQNWFITVYLVEKRLETGAVFRC